MTPDLPTRPRGPRTKPASLRPRLVLLKRASEAIGVPYRTLLRFSTTGEFATVTLGRLKYVEWTVLDRWLESRTERRTA